MTDTATVGEAAEHIVAAAEVARVEAIARAARSTEGVDALARVVAAAHAAGLVSVEDLCAAYTAIAAERARLASVLAQPVETGGAAGDRRVAVMLTPEGVEGLRTVVELHPLPWLVDGRELVDARGEVAFAAAPGAVTAAEDRRGERDLLLGLLAAVVAEAGSRK